MENVLAVTAIVLSASALGVSLWTGLINRRAAIAAESAGLAADRSADAAKESAEHARRSADAAERVARTEASRDHEMYRPRVPDMTAAVALDRNNPHGSRYLAFTVDRTYRVAGDIIRDGGSRTPLDIRPVIAAGEAIRVWIDDKATPADSLNIRFWPALADDPGEKWQCPCDGPTTPDGPVHWEWNLEVPKRRGPPVVY